MGGSGIAGAPAVTVFVEALRHIRSRLDDGAANDARAELERLRRVIVEEPRERRVPIDCLGLGCRALGPDSLLDLFGLCGLYIVVIEELGENREHPLRLFRLHVDDGSRVQRIGCPRMSGEVSHRAKVVKLTRYVRWKLRLGPVDLINQVLRRRTLLAKNGLQQASRQGRARVCADLKNLVGLTILVAELLRDAWAQRRDERASRIRDPIGDCDDDSAASRAPPPRSRKPVHGFHLTAACPRSTRTSREQAYCCPLG